MKDKGANRLLTSNHVTALLEIHADELECGAFHNKWKHSHCCFSALLETGIVVALLFELATLFSPIVSFVF